MIPETCIPIRLVVGIAAVLAMLASAGAARADTRLNGANQRWQAADKCTRTAFTHYPDYTVEGAQKRDQYVRACLRNNRLPPRQDLAPAPTAATPQQ